MDCREIEELLSAYIDGELDGAEALAVTEHLSICPECRWELIRLQETINVIRNLPELEPPADFHQRLCQRLNTLKERKPWYKRFAFNQWLGLGTVAAAVLLCIVSLNGINPLADLSFKWPATQQGTEILSSQAREEKQEPAPDSLATPVPQEDVQAQELQDIQAEEELMPNPSDQESSSLGVAQHQERSSSPKKTMLQSAPTQVGEAFIAENRSVKQEILTQTSPSDNKSFSYRNGNYREREEIPADSMQLAAVAEAELLAGKESYPLPTCNINLKVKDLYRVKNRLEDLLFSHGATIREWDLYYLEVTLPSISLDKVLALMNSDYLPGITQINISSVIYEPHVGKNTLEELREKIELKEKELLLARDSESIQILKQELQNLRWQWKILSQNNNTNEIDHILLKIYLQT